MFNKMMMLAATTASLVAVPTAAEARHHDRYHNNYAYGSGYGYRSYGYRDYGYGYPRSSVVISVGSPGASRLTPGSAESVDAMRASAALLSRSRSRHRQPSM